MTASALSDRDDARLRAIAKWAREGTVMLGGLSPEDLSATEFQDLAFQFCFSKVRWASLALTSCARHALPDDLRQWLSSARRAIRDYRHVDLRRLVELSKSSEQIAALALSQLSPGAKFE